ncbi:hypothetical protein DV735_g3050, partial [Chaetothyriales sp. CBS 134920]
MIFAEYESEQPDPWSAQQSQSSTPLLPSPISREHKDRPGTGQEYKSYADLHILSFYDGNAATRMAELSSQLLTDEAEQHASDSSDSPSEETEDLPATPSAPVQSEEPDWPLSATSPPNKTKRSNARCCQVVQVPADAEEAQNYEKEAMLATIIVGPGKAKLVAISRPNSQRTSRSSAQSSTQTKPETEEVVHTQTKPETEEVVHIQTKPETEEVVRTPSTDTVPDVAEAPEGPKGPGAPQAAEEPKAPQAAEKSKVPEAPVLSANAKPSLHTINTHTSPRPSTRRLSVTSTQSTGAKGALSAQANLPTPPLSLPPSPTEALSRQLRLRRLERTLDAITHAFDTSTLLVLSSPAISPLRSVAVPDTAYIETLSKIFPETQEVALSALAACVILDLYLARVIQSCSHPDDPLTSTSSRQSGESFHTIPSKARSLLGIDHNISTSADRVHETELVQRAVIMSECVDAVSRTLMELCRGGNWDADVWQSLRCLVELMEDAGDGGSLEGAAAWV